MGYTISQQDSEFICDRDNYKCRYCGLDGTNSFEDFRHLELDHLLPKDHPKRDDRDFIVAACDICNGADNRYFNKVEQYGLKLDNMTPDELVQQRKPYVEKWIAESKAQWVELMQTLGKK